MLRIDLMAHSKSQTALRVEGWIAGEGVALLAVEIRVTWPPLPRAVAAPSAVRTLSWGQVKVENW